MGAETVSNGIYSVIVPDTRDVNYVLQHIIYTPTWSGLGSQTRPSGFSTVVCLAAHDTESP
jgi:hypothetical protein